MQQQQGVLNNSISSTMDASEQSVPQSGAVAETSTNSRPHGGRKAKDQGPLEPLADVLLNRITVIKEGDNVLLRLPSDAVKAVVASSTGCVHFVFLLTSSLIQLGKFGAFPAKELLGLHYDITYEIAPDASTAASTSHATPTGEAEFDAPASDFGQAKSKRKKNKGEKGEGATSNNPGWKNILRPLKTRPILDAVIGKAARIYHADRRRY